MSTSFLIVWVTLNFQPSIHAGPIQQVPATTQTSRADLAGVKSVVPFSMLPSNHMLVRAMINGKGPYRLIFDLGAPITLLSNEASEAAGVVEPNRGRSFLFGMRGEAEVARLQVGSLTATKLPVIVFDHPALKLLGQTIGQSIDGIMGFTFFARFRTTIDYQVNEMTFEPVNFRMRDLLKELPERLGNPRAPREQILAPTGLWGFLPAETRESTDAQGILIKQVLPASPAAIAGFKPGDILTAMDGRWTASILDVYSAARGIAPGQDVSVVILRDGKELTLTVRPAEGI